MVTHYESEMVFGPFRKSKLFRIEESNVYAENQVGVKIADLVVLRGKIFKDKELLIIEAKSSSPQPVTQPNFDDFILEIRDKLVNSLDLTFACILKRHRRMGTSSLPSRYRYIKLRSVRIMLILVIRGHQLTWLEPIQRALSAQLSPTIKTWNLGPNSVKVLNDDLAREFGLIT